MVKKRNKKGRTMGGRLMRIQKYLWEIGTKIKKEREEMLVGKVRLGKEKWRIVGIYTGKERIEETLNEMEQSEEETYTIIGGNFNARREEGREEEFWAQNRKKEKSTQRMEK